MEMILLKKQKRLQVPSIIASVMVIMTLLISVGYSAFNTKLNVKDIKAVVRVEKDVRVTNITIKETSNGGVSNWEDYNINNISASVTLPQSTSTVTYNVEVTNIGTEEVGILQVIEENLPSELTYSISEYTLKSKICDNTTTTKCNLGAKKSFKVTIKYKTGASASNTAHNFVLKFDFRGFHKITYQNITSTNLPKEIMDGDTLEVTLKDITKVYVTQVGKPSMTYTLTNNKLTIPNVTGDISILGYKSLYATIKNGAVLDTNIDFTRPAIDDNGEGKYIFSSTKSNAYPIYYYRGYDTLNNNVLFANLCWRIVRTTDTGGIKMIYKGKPNGLSCTQTSLGLETDGFAWGSTSFYYSSDIFNFLNTWFSKNLEKGTLFEEGADRDYSKYLEDAIWYQHNYNAPGNAERVANGKPDIRDDKAAVLASPNVPIGFPSYVSCPTDHSVMCYHIDNPIGLISVDEAMLAGASVDFAQTYLYPYSDYTYLLLTDLNNMVKGLYYNIDVIQNGSMFDFVQSNYTPVYVLPSISLKNSVTYVNGDGSASKPYEIINY